METTNITSRLLILEQKNTVIADQIKSHIREALKKENGLIQPINPFAHSTKIVQAAAKLQMKTLDFYDGEGDIEAYTNGLYEIVELCAIAMLTQLQVEIDANKVTSQPPTA